MTLATTAFALSLTIGLGIVGCDSRSGGDVSAGGGTRTSGGAVGGGLAGTGGAPPGAGGSGSDAASLGGSAGTAVGGSAGGAGGTGASGRGGTAAGGAGAGGGGVRATGGNAVGGAGSGGATVLDAGCDGSGCGVDAGDNDLGVASCGQISTQSACDLRADCHSVFASTGCELDAGHTCERFQHCADGRKANCAGPALCDSVAPTCPPGDVVAYVGSCYEGCVHQNQCPTPVCPQIAPSKGASCGVVDYSCFYEDCAGTGRTQAVCTAGTWSVQTAACGPITCAGAGVLAQTVTCAAGQVCVRTTSGGGAYMVTPSCAANNCGAGPVSPQCIQGASDCGLSSSLSGIEVSCFAPSSCGSGMGGCA